MGIKGLYEELGTPDRVPLAKLSIDHLRAHNRPIKVAIDIAIWLFQSQAVQGRGAGPNAPLRVLYYRLCTLLKLNIHAIFVFDGRGRPDFKRNKIVNKNEGYHTALTRRLITAFGFPIHNAPGEAEAECAYLQRLGIVDAVLSEDVDTLMFGCTQFWRFGSNKGDSKHLDTLQVYKSTTIHQQAKLTSSGMVLMALMSGGDYDSAGIAKVGIKQAAAAAKAGYGEDLIRAYQTKDSDGGKAMLEWRERLETSLKTNHERLFAKRQPNVNIPDGFPDYQILEFYINPKVSETPPVINWGIQLNLELLRDITKAKFEWSGTGKLIRTLSEGLLSWKLGQAEPGAHKLVLDIHQRSSSSRDGTPDKLRLTFAPLEVVPLQYDHEADNVHAKSAPITDSDALLENQNGYSDSDKEDIRINGVATTEFTSRRPERPKTEYNPGGNQRVWVYEDFVKLGAGGLVHLWDENEASKKAAKEERVKAKEQRTKAGKPKQKTGSRAPPQKTLTAYYSQRKPAADPVEKPVAADSGGGAPGTCADPIIIDTEAAACKENTPVTKPKKAAQESRAKGKVKVVTRESLPGAWIAIKDDGDWDKYDDRALEDVTVCDLTDVQ